jgi:predicted lipid carrier protein YhbT
VPDGAGEWTVRPGEGASCVVTRDHAKADTALRGEAHDLLMVLWRRAPLDSVTVFGDEALAQAFVGRAGTE